MHFHRWKRREVVALLGGAVAWPIAARTQQTRGPYRVGFLGLLPGENTTTLMKALLERLNELGYREDAAAGTHADKPEALARAAASGHTLVAALPWARYEL